MGEIHSPGGRDKQGASAQRGSASVRAWQLLLLACGVVQLLVGGRASAVTSSRSALSAKQVLVGREEMVAGDGSCATNRGRCLLVGSAGRWCKHVQEAAIEGCCAVLW